MKVKPLKKITVKELVEDCGLNRKTFYYHFEDIYDLIKWILEDEAVKVVNEFDFNTDFSDAVSFVLDYVEENAYMLSCTYDSLGRDQMKKFLYQDFLMIVKKFIIEYLDDDLVEDSYKQFVCHFYCEGIAGMLIEWIQNPERMDKEKVIVYLETILEISIPALLKVQVEA